MIIWMPTRMLHDDEEGAAMQLHVARPRPLPALIKKLPGKNVLAILPGSNGNATWTPLHPPILLTWPLNRAPNRAASQRFLGCCHTAVQAKLSIGFPFPYATCTPQHHLAALVTNWFPWKQPGIDIPCKLRLTARSVESYWKRNRKRRNGNECSSIGLDLRGRRALVSVSISESASTFMRQGFWELSLIAKKIYKYFIFRVFVSAKVSQFHLFRFWHAA